MDICRLKNKVLSFLYSVLIIIILVGCENNMTKQGIENIEFNCKEVDYAPKIPEEAETLFQEARALDLKTGNKNQYHITDLFQQAADKGSWKAEYHLARRYALGEGVTRDNKKSQAIIDSLVARDIPLGYYALAMNKDRDINLKKAAERGNPQAQYTLGEEAYMVYDYALAKKYYRCAAEQGVKDAAYALAMRAEISEENYPKAVEYYVLAGSLGSEDALNSLYFIFRSDNEKTNLGYEKDLALSNCFNQYRQQIKKDPSLKFPDLAEKCPIGNPP